jgi:hypothetical protein
VHLHGISDHEPGLFPYLATARVLERFTRFHESARKSPARRRISPAHEDNVRRLELENRVYR